MELKLGSRDHGDKKLSSAAREIFEHEKLRGDKIANRFRYLLIALIIPMTLTGFNTTATLISNISMIGLYFMVTLLQTVSISKGSLRAINLVSYIAVISDVIAALWVSIFYYLTISPDNPAYFFKQPSLGLLLMSGCLAVLQFRSKQILVYGLLVFIGMGVMLVHAITKGMPITDDWNAYLMGDKIVLNAYLTISTAVMIAFISTLWYSVVRSGRMSKKIADLQAKKKALSRYFPEVIADQIMMDPDLINKGRRIKATILFSDIRGFTSISESMATEELVGHLAAYREIMVEEIFLKNGMVDKFIGDGIMAVFGAPSPSVIQGEDTINAIRAGKSMLDRMDEFNTQRGFKGEKKWDMGIGIHVGQVFAGNVGSELLFEYSVIGDTVNTASRVEGLCKQLGAKFLITKSVRDEVGELFKTQSKGIVEIRGKSNSMEIFEVS